MRARNKGTNRLEGQCRNCGAELAVGEGIVNEVWGYPWDGSDAEGSITELLDSYMECAYATDCARRVVEQGTDIYALRRVARDYENLGELATQAREILREYAELAQAQAVTDDMVAREGGWGAIRHSY